MIRVIVELVPHGFESQKKTIGNIVIHNNGEGNIKEGSYNASFTYYKESLDGWICGSTTDKITHTRNQNFFILIYNVLKDIIQQIEESE
jgi:hypothetical protein